MGMERLLADWQQLDLFVNLLARSGSGQHLSSYTNVITGPRREGEADGPDELHVVILDNGRSEILGTEMQEILSCIRCGACLNVCPVYRQIGGHAYGWVYSGPVGAVLTPLLAHAHEEAAELANASTLCGACMDACPVSIPLQDLLLALRRRRAARRRRRRAQRVEGVGDGVVTPEIVPRVDEGGEHGPRARPVRRPRTRAHEVDGRTRGARARGPHVPRALAAPETSDGPARVLSHASKRQLATPAPPTPRTRCRRCQRRVPEVESHLLDPHDLPGSFERAAKAVSAEVHRINGNRVPPELVAELVERYGVKRAVISAEPEAAAVADELRALAVEVEPLSIEAAARADLGVTSASYGLATTGTVVQESAVAGGRTASLLPPVHLCVLPASRLVPSTSAVLRTLRRPRALAEQPRADHRAEPVGRHRADHHARCARAHRTAHRAARRIGLTRRDVYAPRVPKPPGVLKCASSEQAFWRSRSCSQSPRAATTAAAAAATPAGAAVATSATATSRSTRASSATSS